MAFCSGCGSELGSGVGFCPKCGKPVGSAAGTASAMGAAPGGAAPAAAAGSGLDENVAALLSYVLGWLTGLIFFLIDKRPFVRFHAMQSIILFGGVHLLFMVLMFTGFMGGMSWATSPKASPSRL
jgi:zinc ribbon protein